MPPGRDSSRAESPDILDLCVARVNAEHRAAWQAEKKQAQEAQRKRREQGLEDRRAQTTALMALAMGVVSRMQESEREPEFFRENDET